MGAPTKGKPNIPQLALAKLGQSERHESVHTRGAKVLGSRVHSPLEVTFYHQHPGVICLQGGLPPGGVSIQGGSASGGLCIKGGSAFGGIGRTPHRIPRDTVNERTGMHSFCSEFILNLF